jgi:hypothetical protein
MIEENIENEKEKEKENYRFMFSPTSGQSSRLKFDSSPLYGPYTARCSPAESHWFGINLRLKFAKILS